MYPIWLPTNIMDNNYIYDGNLDQFIVSRSPIIESLKYIVWVKLTIS